MGAVTIGLALMLAPTDAKAAAATTAAAKADFATCDGYKAPSKKADGITQGTWLAGLATITADVRRNQIAIGGAAGAACDRALADPLLTENYWLRRAHLLQAKAFHHLADGQFDAGLKALDQSDAIGRARGDRHFEDSVVQGNRALRAVALYRLGRKDEGRAQVEAMRRARPHANSQRNLSHQVQLIFEGDRKTHGAMLLDSIPYDPGLLTNLFWMSMLYDGHADAVRYGAQIGFDLPRGRGGWEVDGADERPYELIGTRAEVAGAGAYALLATGNAAGADAALAEAKAQVEAAMAPPPTPAEGRKVSRKAQMDHAKRVVAGQRATARLDQWTRAMKLRRDVSGMTLTQLFDRMKEERFTRMPIVTDLVRQAKLASAEEKAALPLLLAEVEGEIEKERRQVLGVDFADLVKLLPRPESAAMRPSFKRADSIIASGNNGFSVKSHKDSQSLTVRFGSDVASAAMVEELALLTAADQARKAGKSGFLVEARMLVQRTTRISGYYGIGGTDVPTGYEAQLKILPVDVAALPPGLEASRWRVLDAGAIQTALGPKYAAAR